jgi:hypothetical protein
MLLAPIPWAGRVLALPFLSVLASSERYYQQRGRRPNKMTDRARQMLCLVKRWLPHRPVVVVADSSFAAIELLAAVGKSVCMITRLRLDAALYDPAPPRAPGTNGRPRRKGTRQPPPQAMADNPATVWQSVRIERWYSQGPKEVDIASGSALWVHSGTPTVPLRWVVVRNPAGTFAPQAFLCTDEAIAPAQILSWFVRRWQMEVTFEEARAHLSMETQRQWPDRAIARTTPLLLGLYSVVTLLASPVTARRKMPVRRACCYHKDRDLLGHDCAGTPPVVARKGFFHVGPDTGYGENPPHFVRAPDRYRQLCGLIGQSRARE